MRWDCPHCHTQLTVTDDKLQTGWSFSRCFQCGGFSLVRKSDVNLIKIDQAPNGERVVATEKPTPALTGPAFHPMVSNQLRPTVRPAARAAVAPAAAPKPSKTWNWSTLAIAVASATALVSGALLYLEGQALWAKSKVQENTQIAAIAPAPPVQLEPLKVPPEPIQEPVKEQISVTAAAPAHPSNLRVRVRTSYANLRTGPSLDFQVSGMLSQGTLLEVVDFEDRWFKIVPVDQAVQAAQSVAPARWIRNDMVQMAQLR